MNFGIKGKATLLSDIEDKPINPFVDYLVNNEKFVLKRLKKDELTKYLETQNNELKEAGLEVGKRKKIRTAPFTQVYWGKKVNYKQLSPAANKIILHIIYDRMEYNRDTIMLSVKDLRIDINLSKTTTSNAIIELYNDEIIDKRSGNIWWINPAYFYCGNRHEIKTK